VPSQEVIAQVVLRAGMIGTRPSSGLAWRCRHQLDGFRFQAGSAG